MRGLFAPQMSLKKSCIIKTVRGVEAENEEGRKKEDEGFFFASLYDMWPSRPEAIAATAPSCLPLPIKRRTNFPSTFIIKARRPTMDPANSFMLAAKLAPHIEQL